MKRQKNYTLQVGGENIELEFIRQTKSQAVYKALFSHYDYKKSKKHCLTIKVSVMPFFKKVKRKTKK